MSLRLEIELNRIFYYNVNVDVLFVRFLSTKKTLYLNIKLILIT